MPDSTSKCECPARKALAAVFAGLLQHDAAISSASLEHIRAALAAPCPCEELREKIELQRQAIARLSSPGIERAPWFYAPCPNCGAIEGMGLVTAERKRGELLRGYTSVWCCQCEHFGPPIRQEIGKVEENDRAATMAWNAEFAAAFAAGRAALAKARGETPDA